VKCWGLAGFINRGWGLPGLEPLNAGFRPGALLNLMLNLGPVKHLLAANVVGDQLALVYPIVDGLALHSKDALHVGSSHQILWWDHACVRLAAILGLDPAEFEHQAVDLVRDVPLAGGPSISKKDGRLKGSIRTYTKTSRWMKRW
jgi:hypothetical protein